MKKQLTVCATLLALVGTAATAHAQYGPAYPRVYRPGLPAYQVLSIVRATGMTPLSQPIRRGPNYVVIAAGRAGGQVRVVVNGYNGMIMRVRPVVAMRPYGRPYAPVVADAAPRPPIAGVPRDIKDPPPVVYGADPYGPPSARVEGGPPLPPRAIPNARLAAAPPTAVPPPMAAPHPVAPAVAVSHPVAPHVLAAQPPVTPLPRPRPMLAENEVTGAAPPPSAPPSVRPVGEGGWPVPAKSAAGETKPGASSSELKMVPVAPLD